MKCLFVYNEQSGGSKEINYHEQIIEYLNNLYDHVDAFHAGVDNDLHFVLENNHYDDVICSGGDGSIAILVNKLISYGFQGNIGYIPLGTANDFARNHKIPLNVEKSLDIIKNKKSELVHLGIVNEKVMLYALAIGKLSGVSYKTKSKEKKSLTKFSYLLTGIKELFSNKKIELKLIFDFFKIDYKTPLMLVLDSNTLGGFKVNHKKKNAYDVLIFKGGALRSSIGIIGMFLFGYKKTNTRFYDYFNLQNFEIELMNEQSWCLDGEEFKSQKVNVSAHRERINLYKK